MSDITTLAEAHELEDKVQAIATVFGCKAEGIPDAVSRNIKRAEALEKERECLNKRLSTGDFGITYYTGITK